MSKAPSRDEAQRRRDRRKALRLLAKLDVPPCDCNMPLIPCRHEAPVVARWLAQLLAWWAYGENGPAPKKDPKTCDCPDHREPCGHVLAAAEHQLSPAKWAAYLELAQPGEYEERPEPPRLPRKKKLVSVRAAVREMQKRFRAKLALRRVDDPWMVQRNNDGVRVGPEVTNVNNGESVQTGRVLQAGEAGRAVARKPKTLLEQLLGESETVRDAVRRGRELLGHRQPVRGVEEDP